MIKYTNLEYLQLVHDQTVRYMNKGLQPDQITQLVRLPPHLEDHPFLQQFYGTVEWSVKAVFCNYMGWFSGKASDLHPMEEVAHSKAMLELAGGPENLSDKMEVALHEGNYQWALELAEVLLDTKNKTDLAKVKWITSTDGRGSNVGLQFCFMTQNRRSK